MIHQPPIARPAPHSASAASQLHDDATDFHCETDTTPEDPHPAIRALTWVVVFYLVVGIALVILTSCKSPATRQSPFPRMLDPVTEEVPCVLFK
jgi:hypothetical protein